MSSSRATSSSSASATCQLLLLLDTCMFLWAVAGDTSLSARARDAFTSPDNEVYLSAVSAWEVTLKYSLGALPLPAPPHEFLPAQRAAHGVEPLALDEDATYYLARLPKRSTKTRSTVCWSAKHSPAR